MARVTESYGQARQLSYTTILSGFNDAVRKSNGEITVQLMMEDEMLTFCAHIIATNIDRIIERLDTERLLSQFMIADKERRVLKRGSLSCEEAHSYETIKIVSKPV